MTHVRFWWWAIRVKVCEALPGTLSCLIHGFSPPPLPNDDPCWERAGWSKP
jgi:hypothetical protein